MLLSRARAQKSMTPISLWQARVRQARSSEAATDSARNLPGRTTLAPRHSSERERAQDLAAGAAEGPGSVAMTGPAVAASSQLYRSSGAASPYAALCSTALPGIQPPAAAHLSGARALSQTCQHGAAPCASCGVLPQPKPAQLAGVGTGDEASTFESDAAAQWATGLSPASGQEVVLPATLLDWEAQRLVAAAEAGQPPDAMRTHWRKEIDAARRGMQRTVTTAMSPQGSADCELPEVVIAADQLPPRSSGDAGSTAMLLNASGPRNSPAEKTGAEKHPSAPASNTGPATVDWRARWCGCRRLPAGNAAAAGKHRCSRLRPLHGSLSHVRAQCLGVCA